MSIRLERKREGKTINYKLTDLIDNLWCDCVCLCVDQEFLVLILIRSDLRVCVLLS